MTSALGASRVAPLTPSETPLLISAVELFSSEALVDSNAVVREEAGPLGIQVVSKRSRVDGEIVASPEKEAVTCGDVALGVSVSAGTEEGDCCLGLGVPHRVAAVSAEGGLLPDSVLTAAEASALSLLRFRKGVDSESGLALPTSAVFIHLKVSLEAWLMGWEGLLPGNPGNVEGTGKGEVVTGEDWRTESEVASVSEGVLALNMGSGPVLRGLDSSQGGVSIKVVAASHAVVDFSPAKMLRVSALGDPVSVLMAARADSVT